MSIIDCQDEAMNPFKIHSRREILALLRNIKEQRQLVHLSIDRGVDVAITSILEIDAVHDRMFFDPAKSALINQRIIESELLSFETLLDNIRILFAASGVTSQPYKDGKALVLALPACLIRLQRRAAYRVATPIAMPVLCRVPVTIDDETPPAVATLYNISSGGLAMVDKKMRIDVTIGRIYDNCHIELPGQSVTVSLKIAGSMVYPLPNGKNAHRVRCQFFNPPNAALGTIQKYITKLERDHNARMAGMR